MIHDPVALVGVILATGLVARAIADALRIPEVLFLLGAGVLLGPSVLGLVRLQPDDRAVGVVFTLGVGAILFGGGMALSLPVLNRVRRTLLALAIPGVLLTAAIVGAAGHHLLGLPWEVALLAGAVLSPTDPAILIPLLLRTRIRPKVVQTLVGESALNDPTGAVLALAVAGAAAGHADVLAPMGDFAGSLILSTLAGALVGGVLAVAISTHPAGLWRASAPVVLICLLGLTVAGLNAVGASGYLGCFVAGLIAGNARLLRIEVHADHDHQLRSFAEAAADTVTMLVFLLLGASLPLAAIADDPWPPILLVAVLMLVARPIAILACTAGDRSAAWTRGELAFLCWSRETGVVPAALVGILAARGVPGSELLAGAVGVAVVATVVFQALPAARLARALGLDREATPTSG
ncbi:MAG: potassium/hydrogen antiporter [Solirubrobacteraceae bacterium]|nr:potassium/hydrogen antiporter [Solirubrobacteraceae bacterium]